MENALLGETPIEINTNLNERENNMSQQPQRQTWSSKLTYIMTVAGATVGFGATWRFPYLVGENGGGAYVLLFCIAMLLIGIPMILVENVIGRRLRVNSIDAFGDKLKDKNISNTGKSSAIWVCSAHSELWHIIWCLAAG